MSRLTLDGTAKTVSQDQFLRHERGQGNSHFSCSADLEQDWQPYAVDPYSCDMCDHTYIHKHTHTYIHEHTECDLVQTYWLPLTEVSRVPPLPSYNGPQPLIWTRVTPSVSYYHSILGVCTTVVVLLLLYSNYSMCCALCVCISFLFSEIRAVLLQRAGAAVHNYRSEYSTVIGRTNYNAAPAQQYNFDAAPAPQYSPPVNPPEPPASLLIGGITTASARSRSQLSNSLA